MASVRLHLSPSMPFTLWPWEKCSAQKNSIGLKEMGRGHVVRSGVCCYVCCFRWCSWSLLLTRCWGKGAPFLILIPSLKLLLFLHFLSLVQTLLLAVHHSRALTERHHWSHRIWVKTKTNSFQGKQLTGVSAESRDTDYIPTHRFKEELEPVE